MIIMANQEYLNAWGNVDNEENNGGGGSQDRPDFLKVSIGSTKVRVLDMFPYSYKEWWAVRGNGGEGCSIPYFNGGKDLLEAANKAFMKKVFNTADKKGLKDTARKDFLRDEGYKKQPFGKVKEKHIIHVLDRATGEIKLLDKGNGIFKKLKKLALDPEYGDLRNYDVTIVMSGDPKDFTSIEYDVTPARQNTELTQDEIDLYEEKKIDLKEFKGGGNMTPEQALAIAKGATFKDVLGDGSDSSEEAEEKSDESMLPEEEKASEKEPRKDEPVDVESEEPLSEDDLNGIDFG